MPIALSKVIHPGALTSLSKQPGGVTVWREQRHPAFFFLQATHRKAEVGFCKSQAIRAVTRSAVRVRGTQKWGLLVL